MPETFKEDEAVTTFFGKPLTWKTCKNLFNQDAIKVQLARLDKSLVVI